MLDHQLPALLEFGGRNCARPSRRRQQTKGSEIISAAADVYDFYVFL